MGALSLPFPNNGTQEGFLLVRGGFIEMVLCRGVVYIYSFRNRGGYSVGKAACKFPLIYSVYYWTNLELSSDWL